MHGAFGGLLKVWRVRRRLSQFDLALAAEVSARHISFMETGRARPSRGMVLQLAEVMDVPRAERNALLNAAGYAPAYAARDSASQDLHLVRAAMSWTLERHDPYPAIAVDRHWRLLQLNRCASMLLGSMHLGPGDSLLDAFLQPGPFRAALDNWQLIARQMIVRLRTESAHLGGDPVLDRAISAIAAAAAAEGIGAGMPYPAVVAVEFRTASGVLSLFSTIAQFSSAEDIALADMKIELMFPADEATRVALLGMQ